MKKIPGIKHPNTASLTVPISEIIDTTEKKQNMMIRFKLLDRKNHYLYNMVKFLILYYKEVYL